MAKTVVKANLTGAVIQTVRAQVAMMKANIKIFVSVSSKSTFFPQQSVIKLNKIIFYLMKSNKFNDI